MPCGGTFLTTEKIYFSKENFSFFIHLHASWPISTLAWCITFFLVQLCFLLCADFLLFSRLPMELYLTLDSHVANQFTKFCFQTVYNCSEVIKLVTTADREHLILPLCCQSFFYGLCRYRLCLFFDSL